MYGNGVKIGLALTVVHHKTILQGLLMDSITCTVEVAGVTMFGIVTRPTVSAVLLTPAALLLVYAWFSPSNGFLF